MFARTPRLTLRPGWIEDAPALTAAIAHESVVTKLARVPWPYGIDDAREYLAHVPAPGEASSLIFAPDSGGRPLLIGTAGIHRADDGGYEIGYWLTPAAWGRGYATEAGRALIDAARHTFGHRRLTAYHHLDNPASGAVLRKLGFRPTGRIEARQSRGRGISVPSATYTLAFDDVEDADGPRVMLAA